MYFAFFVVDQYSVLRSPLCPSVSSVVDTKTSYKTTFAGRKSRWPRPFQAVHPGVRPIEEIGDQAAGCCFEVSSRDPIAAQGSSAAE